MKTNQLTKLSLEELVTKEATQKKAMTVLGAVLMLLFLVCLGLSFREDVSVFTALPVAFFPLYAIGMRDLKKIREEIQSRKQ
jgi:hypothetical protein